MNSRTDRQVRSVSTTFETREQEGSLKIEGYFAVFGPVYNIWEGATESVQAGAFSETLGEDIRALIDHETRLVLGRNRAGSLQLREDEHGLWASITINQHDVDAMNLYYRVQRGDVNQCSFGFDILDEDFVQNGNAVHWTIKKVRLYEVSVVTFPAYEDTNVSARKRQLQEHHKRELDMWRMRMRAKMKGEFEWH